MAKMKGTGWWGCLVSVDFTVIESWVEFESKENVVLSI